MTICTHKPEDPKAFISDVGEDLVRTHGKRKYYKPADIQRSAERCGYPVDVHCWALSVFSSAEDFRVFHEAADLACDYAAMKAEMLAALTDGGSFSWFDLDLSWLDWPDIDLSSVFDWFDWFDIPS